jgi:hypothetical protein
VNIKVRILKSYGQNKNGSFGLPFVKIFSAIGLHSFLLDPRALTAPAAQEVKFSAAYLTGLVQNDRFDIRRVHRESSFNSHSVRYFTHCECCSSSLALALDHIAFKALDTLLITFNDLVVDGNIVACLEFWRLFLRGQLLVYKSYCGIHIRKIWTAKVEKILANTKI